MGYEYHGRGLAPISERQKVAVKISKKFDLNKPYGNLLLKALCWIVGNPKAPKTEGINPRSHQNLSIFLVNTVAKCRDRLKPIFTTPVGRKVYHELQALTLFQNYLKDFSSSRNKLVQGLTNGEHSGLRNLNHVTTSPNGFLPGQYY